MMMTLGPPICLGNQNPQMVDKVVSDSSKNTHGTYGDRANGFQIIHITYEG